MNIRANVLRSALTWALLLMLAASTSCGPREAEPPPETSTSVVDTPYDPIARGQAHYQRYCASCHGFDGRGGGPVAEALKDPPSDITGMRTEGDGTFRVDELIEIIRGVKDVRAHGTREMPVWGNIWGDADMQQATPEQIQTRINELVEYIRSIQEPVASPLG